MVPKKRDGSERGVDSYPLSPMQQGMLFHSLEASSPGVDVEQVVGELHHDVGVAEFERAWRDVVDRHSMLRTSFHWQNHAEPRQVVHAPTDVRLGFSYEEFGSEHEARRGLEEYLVEDRRQGFRLDEAPLLRVALIRGGARHYWWVCTFHHTILDGRAMVVVFREALELHDALAAGRSLDLPPARPYRAYIDWLQTLDWSRAEKFWRTQLDGFSAPVALPIDRGTSGREAADGHGELGTRVSEGLTQQLRAAARRLDVTVNTLLQAGWALLLSRYSGETDVVFGAVRACRHIPVEGAGSMVGLFINTVPVRVQLPPQAGVAATVHQLREQWVALRDHEHTPLMKLQQWSDVAPGRPLFETLFNYQEPSWDEALRALGGVWQTRQFEIRSQPNYPLAVDAYGSPAAIIIKLLYDRRRFADESIARMLGHYRVLLEGLATEGVSTVGELPLLTAEESQQLLVRWNSTGAVYPKSTNVHTLVERQAAESPGRLAVVDGETKLSYGELNRRANQLAWRLRQLGVSADVKVAVCMERSAEMIVAWLGVLKAGGAFVPLDPAYPKDRLAFQLGDCGAPVLLTQPHVRPTLPPAPAALNVLELTPGAAELDSGGGDNLNVAVGPNDLAYVIYTSGSTGQPKGVQIEHAALMNLVTWHQRTYQVRPDDRATHVASPAFDAAVWEIWPYLASGASIWIPNDETRITPAQLVGWMAEKGITLAFLPTPLAEAALGEVWPRTMALRALLTGGDKLKRPAPADLPCALVNHYGPTESTVVATCGEVPRGSAALGAPTIGRPIANTRAYVLDANRQPVPVGVPGELYLGGESLARGYLNRPELTAEKFVDFKVTGERLYRTGDLVRWRADGELEFLGRLDGQVKIRGCRIELGEIESALQHHRSVREAIVLPLADAQGHLQLVGYVLTQPDAPAAGATQLGEFLKACLPAYMVPSAFVFLDAWPLTSNGKIDRKALPAPAVHGATPTDAPSAPRGTTEEAVAGVWAEVLGRTSMGRHDNFFEIGGHSLLAAQVITRLNALFSGALSVRSIFDHPTIAALAQEITARLDTNSVPRAALPRVKRRTPRAEMELVQPN